MMVFKMYDNVPSTRYSSVYNVLRLWSISLIPTYIESTDSMIHAHHVCVDVCVHLYMHICLYAVM